MRPQEIPLSREKRSKKELSRALKKKLGNALGYAFFDRPEIPEDLKDQVILGAYGEGGLPEIKTKTGEIIFVRSSLDPQEK